MSEASIPQSPTLAKLLTPSQIALGIRLCESDDHCLVLSFRGKHERRWLVHDRTPTPEAIKEEARRIEDLYNDFLQESGR